MVHGMDGIENYFNSIRQNVEFFLENLVTKFVFGVGKRNFASEKIIFGVGKKISDKKFVSRLKKVSDKNKINFSTKTNVSDKKKKTYLRVKEDICTISQT